MTKILESTADIQEAIEALKNNLPVAIPTETVYGLAAKALSEAAVQTIFVAKGRPSDNPLIVHISSLDMLPQLVDETYTPEKAYSHEDIMLLVPTIYHDAIRLFWPGPLSILLPAASRVPKNVTAGLTTIAVRFPNHPLALRIIDACGFPLAAPSSNTSGRPSPTLASHIYEDLNGKIPYIIDGGLCNSGVESTVLDGLGNVPVILRPGGIAFEDLVGLKGMHHLRVYQKDYFNKELENVPTTPGMKYTHYKPNAQVIIVQKKNTANFNSLERNQDIIQLAREFKTVAIMGSKEFNLYIKECLASTLTDHNSISFDNDLEYARGLFKGFRDVDNLGIKIIFAEAVEEFREGTAIMNRLRKASTKTIVIVSLKSQN